MQNKQKFLLDEKDLAGQAKKFGLKMSGMMVLGLSFGVWGKCDKVSLIFLLK